MTHEEALAKLKEIKNRTGGLHDPEADHTEADNILLALLADQGYKDVAEAWEAISPKWYA